MLEVESGQQPENIHIPEHWNFPERNTISIRGLAVQIIDEDAGHLIFTHYGPYSLEMREMRERGDSGLSPEYLDSHDSDRMRYEYFFNKAGELLDSRFIAIPEHGSHSEFSLIRKRTGEMETLYSIDFTRNAFSISNEEADHVDFSDEGVVSEAGTGIKFQTRDGLITGRIPMIDVIRVQGTNGLRKEDWRLSPFPLGGTTSYITDRVRPRPGDENYTEFLRSRLRRRRGDSQEENRVVVFDRETKNRAFVIERDVLKEQDNRGEEISILMITETHVPSETQKIIKTPIHVNLGQVENAMLSEGSEWRNIDRIVGASLSYSYPPQTPQK